MAVKKPKYSGFDETPATAAAAGRSYVPPVYTLPPADSCPFTAAAGDLTYFWMRAGPFTHRHGKKVQS